jgi:hypothetical protein
LYFADNGKTHSPDNTIAQEKLILQRMKIISPLTINAILKTPVLILACIGIFFSSSANAYSLLTHEAMIDVSWKKTIEPLLLQKYPQVSAEQLIEAHSYAYGGAIMPDIGYSPFGSMIYTDFVHNVRTGDYVAALIEEATDVNEYAFALGSLAHYIADNYGHMLGTNAAVPLVYPKMKAKFGNKVTYADDHKSHSRIEFAFDVLQTARGNYATKAYHDFIGFNISRTLVKKAFYRTYGLNVDDVFGNMSVAISTFRWTIKFLLPNIVRTAWAKKRDEIKKDGPDANARRFSYRMKNRTYYHEFGKDHQKAGFLPTILAVVIPILPKMGPLAKLRFKAPSPEIEKLFIKSFDSTLVHFEIAVAQLHTGDTIHLPNCTLDTGLPTALGDYSIADKNYKQFLLLLYDKNFDHINSPIKRSLVTFYATHPKPLNKRERVNWKEISAALTALDQAVLVSN